MHFQNSKWKDFLGTTHSLLPDFFNFLCPTSASILWRIRISDHVDYIWINVATKITLIVKHSYINLVQCEVLARYLTLARRPGSDLENMWKCTKHFTIPATYRWTKCPKQNQMIIPFPVQGQSQYFCNKHWTIRLDLSVHTHCYFVNGQLIPSDKHSQKAKKNCPHTDMKISRLVRYLHCYYLNYWNSLILIWNFFHFKISKIRVHLTLDDVWKSIWHLMKMAVLHEWLSEQTITNLIYMSSLVQQQKLHW